jgi:hypothetical protein
VVSPKFGLLAARAPGDRQATAHRRSWSLRAAADRLQAPASAPEVLTIASTARDGASATSPGRHPSLRGLQLLGRRRGSVVQRDERAPVHAEVVGLAGVADDPSGLQVSQPAPDIRGVRAQPAAPPGVIAGGNRAPAHDRREPVNELPDRARVVPGALRMPPAPQQPLDRVRARLETIVATRATAARAARDVDERVGLQPPGLGRQRSAPGRMPDAPTRRRSRHGRG